MSIVNRRNAVIGWATWAVVKRLAALKARRGVPARAGKGPSGKKKAVKVAAVAVAAGSALAFWKAKHRDATDYDSVASEEVRVGGDADTTE
jgi:hypothetical protein